MSSRAASAPRPRKSFLERLPARERQRVLAACELVDLVEATVLFEPGDRLAHAYFPIDAYVSLITPVDERPGFEVGMVGSEGMVGITLALGITIAPQRGLVQGSGTAWRMPAAALRRTLAQSPSLRKLLDCYLYVLFSQMAQVGACTRFHPLEARVARWLLMTHDRSPSDSFHLTHAFFGHMLGVRREGITEAAGALQHRNLISYSRGSIEVLDRAGLEAASCPCYAIDQETYARIVGA